MLNLMSSNISAIVDIVALVFVVVYAIFGIIKGFTKTFFAMFGTFLGLILAAALAPFMARFIESKLAWISALTESLSGVLDNFFSRDLSTMLVSSANEQTLEKMGLGGFLIKTVLSAKTSAEIPADSTVMDVIYPTFAYYIVVIISLIALFIIIKLIFFIIGEIVKKHYTNKKIKALDRVLGFVIGIFHGIIVVEMIIMIISIIPVGFFQNVYTGVQLSTFASFLEKINLFRLISSINLVDSVLMLIAQT